MSLDPYRTPAPHPHPAPARESFWMSTAAVTAYGFYEVLVPAGITRAIVVASVGCSVVIGLVWVAICRFSRR